MGHTLSSALDRLVEPSPEQVLLTACSRGDVHQALSLHHHLLSRLPSSSSSSSSSSLVDLSSLIDVNHHLQDGDFPLLLASARLSLPLVELLVDQFDANVDERDHHGCTSLIMATQADTHSLSLSSLSIVRFLVLDGQCDVKLADEDGRTALHYAARMHRDALVIRFLAFVEPQTVHLEDHSHETPLLSLLLHNKCDSITAVQDMACVLVEAGSDVYHENKEGMNAWEIAMRRDQVANIEEEEEEDAIDNNHNLDNSKAEHEDIIEPHTVKQKSDIKTPLESPTCLIMIMAIRERQRKRSEKCARTLRRLIRETEAQDEVLLKVTSIIIEYDSHQKILSIADDRLKKVSFSLAHSPSQGNQRAVIDTDNSESSVTRASELLTLGKTILHAHRKRMSGSFGHSSYAVIEMTEKEDANRSIKEEELRLDMPYDETLSLSDEDSTSQAGTRLHRPPYYIVANR